MDKFSKIFKSNKKKKKKQQEPETVREFYFDEAFEKRKDPELHKQYNFVYCCAYCRAHLGAHSDLISRSFQGSLGRAYLFNRVVNTGKKVPEERLLLTGLHAVSDIYCYLCKHILGWKYEKAFDKSQKYKGEFLKVFRLVQVFNGAISEGKYIIEQAHMIRENIWSREVNLSHNRNYGPPGSLTVSEKSTPTSSAQTTDKVLKHFLSFIIFL